jgi:hypothetical protein
MKECEFSTHALPPHMQIALPQLLNKHTSFPFHSLSGCQQDHRTAPATHTIALFKETVTAHNQPCSCITPVPMWCHTRHMWRPFFQLQNFPWPQNNFTQQNARHAPMHF